MNIDIMLNLLVSLVKWAETNWIGNILAS